MKKTKRLYVILLLIAAMFTLSSCVSNGSVSVVEAIPGQAFDVTMNDWNGSNTFSMELSAGDEVRVDIHCSSGAIALNVTGNNGSAPYSGNVLADMAFTVTVEDADTYAFTLKGSKATGNITVTR
ncbi:MAG TPA: hypothetical protein PKU80_00895 [Candidatus Limiplasma sp.]|nr:hypothetical protein [Candidatus Limiplasma sp.]HRX09001.1 hypothetical protein [Candidatus Limiplasma sp.]